MRGEGWVVHQFVPGERASTIIVQLVEKPPQPVHLRIE